MSSDKWAKFNARAGTGIILSVLHKFTNLAQFASPRLRDHALSKLRPLTLKPDERKSGQTCWHVETPTPGFPGPLPTGVN